MNDSYTIEYRETCSETDIFIALEYEYYNVGFEDLPRWLKQELQWYKVPSREPTELEMWDTVKDAREHS